MKLTHPRPHPAGSAATKWIVTGGVIFVLSVIAPLVVIMPAFWQKSLEAHFIAPGELTVDIDEPGRHTLWHNFTAIRDGVSWNHDPALPNGMQIAVTDDEGRPLDFTTSRATTTVNIGSTSKRAIGSVEIATPKTVHIIVSGEADERLLSLSRSRFAENMRRSLLVIALAFPLGTIGLVLAVIGIIKYAKPPAPHPIGDIPGYEKHGV